jgi:tetratricopeptide (TPR) repeat protein
MRKTCVLGLAAPVLLLVGGCHSATQDGIASGPAAVPRQAPVAAPIPRPASPDQDPAAVRASEEAARWKKYLEDAAVADKTEDRVRRCLDYPDLPGNQWPDGAARAMCAMIPLQEPSLKHIAELLAEPGGPGKLDHEYAAILEAHFKDPSRREALFHAFDDFGTEEGQKLAASWYEKAPRSVFAQAAKGHADMAAAWKARGGKYMEDTSDDQIDAMEGWVKEAVPLLVAALKAEPRLSPACVDLMSAGQIASQPGFMAKVTAHCVEADPLSWHVQAQWLADLDPRWGGSFDEMDKVIEQIKPRVKDNPALASLLIRSDYYRAWRPFDGDNSRLPQIADTLDSLVRIGPDPVILGKAGMAAARQRNPSKALGLLSQSLRITPNDSDFLVERAQVLSSLGDQERALRDARTAQSLTDDACGCRNEARINELVGDLEVRARAASPAGGN